MCYSNCPYEYHYGPSRGDCRTSRGRGNPDAHCYDPPEEEPEEEEE